MRPQRIAARRQGELLCVLAMQELEWLDIEDVDFDDADVNELQDVHQVAGTPVIEDRDPVWTDDIDS